MKYIDIDKLKRIIDFDKGIYYLLAIARKKDNKDLTHTTEIVYRRTIANENKL